MIERILGIIILAGSLAVVFFFETVSFGDGLLRILHWPAMVLTGLGPLGLVLMSFDFAAIGRTWNYVFGESYGAVQESIEAEARVLQRLASRFYDQGPGVFEEINSQGTRETFSKVIDKLSVRVPIRDIRELVEAERERRRGKILSSNSLVALGVRLAPSIGMLGTILGMVRLLSTLTDPSEIGSHMSLALLTTFYGLFFSVVFWTPCQQKLERLLDLELDGYDQILHWLDTIEKRKPVDYFTETFDLPGPPKVA